MLKNKVRIIAGKLRRRVIHFPGNSSIRPTHDRIRETVFSWLTPHLEGATCLDCFAGSGILGFEAISRDAAMVTFFDNNAIAMNAIRENAATLNITNAQMVTAEVPAGLSRLKSAFDIIFLDPPYESGLLEPTLLALEKNKLLKAGTLLYVEQALATKCDLDPEKYKTIREKNTKSISYRLIEYTK